MRTPRAQISVNGRPVASIFNERLIGVTIVDKEGATSDTISCELNDGQPFAEIPKEGDVISAELGYLETGLAYFGSFIADDPEIRCLPYGMTIGGKGANMRNTLEQHRSRHWDDRTLTQIVEEIAAQNGLQARIDAEIGVHHYTWLGQEDESDVHLLDRLARRHGALFSVKDGTLLFSRKGSGQSAGGRDLTAVIASRENIVVGTCRTVFAHRHAFRSVRARVQDRSQARQIDVEVESSAEATATYILPEPFADEAEAERAATSKAEDLKRETMRTSVTLYGDPSIRAGAPFRYQGVRPELDDIDFIVESAKHSLTKAGYTVDVDAKLKV